MPADGAGRQMKLTAFCHPPGHWRMPGAAPTDMSFPEAAHLARVAERGLLDLRQFPLDGPLPDLPPSNAVKARQRMLIDLARRERLSIRELGRRSTFSLGPQVFVGAAAAAG